MALYEFKCPNCGETFERVLPTSLVGVPSQSCPNCSTPSPQVLSVPSNPNFVGSGFYATDYGKGR